MSSQQSTQTSNLDRLTASAEVPARNRMETEAVLFVSQIQIHGIVCRDMYDHAPGYAYFYSSGIRNIPVPPYCSLSTAMKLAEEAYTDAMKDIADSDDDEYDGQFTPGFVVLVDQHANAVQQYSPDKGWITRFVPAEEWPTLLQRAAALSREAGIEAGWDNHSTAESLRQQADSLRRDVAIAQAQSRLIP